MICVLPAGLLIRLTWVASGCVVPWTMAQGIFTILSHVLMNVI